MSPSPDPLSRLSRSSRSHSSPVSLFNLSTGAAGRVGQGSQRPGAGVGAEPAVADAQQGDAGGARAEGGEHRVQPGHPLRQQDELPAAAARHQQEPPAEEHRPGRRGERQQQLRHKQVGTGAKGLDVKKV